jgi:hypothetical protein
MSSTFIIVICLLPILLFLDWTKTFRTKYPDTFGYILSLVGTFVGIVLGLYFTDIQEYRAQKDATVKLLEASKEELEWLKKRCDVVVETLDTLPNRKRDKFLELDIPPFFSETLRSQIMVEMLQPISIEQLNIIKENLLFDTKMMRADYKNKEIDEIKKDKIDYKKQVQLAITIIEKEIKLIEGDLELDTFEKNAKKDLKLLMEDN